MQTCKACGAECRKAQVALVLPSGKRGRVCKRCASMGLLVWSRATKKRAIKQLIARTKETGT